MTPIGLMNLVLYLAIVGNVVSAAICLVALSRRDRERRQLLTAQRDLVRVVAFVATLAEPRADDAVPPTIRALAREMLPGWASIQRVAPPPRPLVAPPPLPFRASERIH